MSEVGSPAVVLIGAPGAGKTRTGKRLARLLEVPIIDTDSVIVERHGPIADIFDTYGEAVFRRWEREAVAEALTQPAIVTLGGGAVLDSETQADLEGLPVVQLTISAEAVERRIAGGKRPLVRGGVGAWSDLVARRQPIYDRLADLTIDTSTVPLDGVAHTIADWLENRA
ncbi:shikimate kinase [Microbacteriaceae bacterium SG_E_30_P1]|uniref:Shikimate kinase n=1 Tax=Antiquaquibacter oligotrophicus TaxID=2880260 RepID=A0ABT6KLV7_9MICO|nr:shikimate kinase [Antiquaquibacter oligotrophicus]MDH6180988.1 shikimate kinase [Antiquaquibacter oligotrophicus]UDF13312.1 shikimate kinase [Antiquaquibacter oligotrophicus]